MVRPLVDFRWNITVRFPLHGPAFDAFSLTFWSDLLAGKRGCPKLQEQDPQLKLWFVHFLHEPF